MKTNAFIKDLNTAIESTGIKLAETPILENLNEIVEKTDALINSDDFKFVGKFGAVRIWESKEHIVALGWGCASKVAKVAKPKATSKPKGDDVPLTPKQVAMMLTVYDAVGESGKLVSTQSIAANTPSAGGVISTLNRVRGLLMVGNKSVGLTAKGLKWIEANK